MKLGAHRFDSTFRHQPDNNTYDDQDRPATLAATPPDWSKVYRRVTRDLVNDTVIEYLFDEDRRWNDP